MAWALLSSELVEDYKWVFKCLMTSAPTWISRHPRPLIESDGDYAIGAAVAQALPGAYHRTCLWHLMRNVSENVSGALKVQAKPYLAAFSAAAAAETFEQFQVHANTMSSLAAVSKKCATYTTDLLSTASSWAHFAVTSIFTAGVRSSQRAESINRTIKMLTDPGTHLPELQRALQQLEEMPLDASVATTSKDLPSFVRSFGGLEWLQSALAPPVVTAVILELEKVPSLRIQDDTILLGKNISAVIRDNHACSCAYPVQHGLPCRHIMAWRHQQGRPVATVADVNPRWLLSHIPHHVVPAATTVSARDEPANVPLIVPSTSKKRFQELFTIARAVVSKGEINAETYVIAHRGMTNVLNDLLFKGSCLNSHTTVSYLFIPNAHQMTTRRTR